MGTKILFVGSSESTQMQLLQFAAINRYQAQCVTTAEAALEQLTREAFDVLITDVVLPGMSGLDLLALCQRQYSKLITTVIAEHGTIDHAVKAMKCGATDFLSKPFSPETLTRTIQVAVERVSRQASVPPGNGGAAPPLIAHSSKMRKLIDQAIAIAPFSTTVLVTGETGTGKELIARAIHQHSLRRQRPFIALNCAAIPDQLLEDELFGHVKGAFTGAQTAREGRFECADGGTLFLDEIGDMSLPLQSKLLRVLQEREFEKLGSSRTIKVDVRVIAATSANLEERVKDGSFRLDLYYRLNVMHLRLPPLLERPEDIRPIAEQLLTRFCASAGLPSKQIDEKVWHVLEAYNWPGNVRQLQNAMERAAALSGPALTIHVSDLPEEIRAGAPVEVVTESLAAQPTQFAQLAQSTQSALLSKQAIPVEGFSLDAVVTNIERELLLRSLSQTGGNKMQAAKLLRMKRTTFVEKLKRLHIEEIGETMIATLAPIGTGSSFFSGFAASSLSAAN